MTSLDSINGRSIQTLLRGENDSNQSDEIQAMLLLAFRELSAPASHTKVSWLLNEKKKQKKVLFKQNTQAIPQAIRQHYVHANSHPTVVQGGG